MSPHAALGDFSEFKNEKGETEEYKRKIPLAVPIGKNQGSEYDAGLFSTRKDTTWFFCSFPCINIRSCERDAEIVYFFLVAVKPMVVKSHAVPSIYFLLRFTRDLSVVLCADCDGCSGLV